MLPDVIDIKNNLPGYGYKPSDDDEIMIRSSLEVTLARLKAYLNRETFPTTRDFYDQVISMAIGEFLYRMKATGKLFVQSEDGEQDNGIYFQNSVKQLTEGDTSLAFNAKGRNDEATFEAWINKLRYGDEFILQHYRRLHW